MKLKVYKTKQIDGEVFATPDVECEYNIDELRISLQAFRQIYKIIPKNQFDQLMNDIMNANFKASVISQLYDILKDSDDELLYFIRRVLVEAGFYITGDQLRTVDFMDQIGILMLIFRLPVEDIKSNFKNKLQYGANDNNQGVA